MFLLLCEEYMQNAHDISVAFLMDGWMDGWMDMLHVVCVEEKEYCYKSLLTK